MLTELLSPAKDKETALAAIDCGADAVYMGASAFGARRNAPNSLEDIKEVVEYAHKFWAKVFITVNTILKDEEIEEAFLHRETRNVRNDATISFRDILYEVPQEYIKKKIVIKFDPSNTNELYIYNDNNERLCSITPINKVDNSKMKRNEKISMYRGE